MAHDVDIYEDLLDDVVSELVSDLINARIINDTLMSVERVHSIMLKRLRYEAVQFLEALESIEPPPEG